MLQQSLLRDTLPVVPRMETAAYYHTASPGRLGGDFCDVFTIDGKRFGFFLGAVCGKGPQTAAITSLTRYTLCASALHDPDPITALTSFNRVLHERYTSGSNDTRYCTAVFGTVEPDSLYRPGRRSPGLRRPPSGHHRACRRHRRLPAHPRWSPRRRPAHRPLHPPRPCSPRETIS